MATGELTIEINADTSQVQEFADELAALVAQLPDGDFVREWARDVANDECSIDGMFEFSTVAEHGKLFVQVRSSALLNEMLAAARKRVNRDSVDITP